MDLSSVVADWSDARWLSPVLMSMGEEDHALEDYSVKLSSF
jgi:hypothetical protein